MNMQPSRGKEISHNDEALLDTHCINMPFTGHINKEKYYFACMNWFNACLRIPSAFL